MRLGAIVRGDLQRGLGIQTWEFFRHMRPDAVLYVDTSRMAAWPQFPASYLLTNQPMYTVIFDPESHSFNHWDQVLTFLDSCDVVWSAETPYDFRLLDEARKRNVKTVIHANYEFCVWGSTRPEYASLPWPDAIWFPSRWMHRHWPKREGVDVRYVPFPIDRERCAYQPRTEARRFLHVVGAPTTLDRNGTRIFTQAVERVGENVEFTMTALTHQSVRARIKTPQPHDNYWDIYPHHDVLVMPRRFGGQCLPMNEALSCGMPVLMSDTEPQSAFFPRNMLVGGQTRGNVMMHPGWVDSFNVSWRELGKVIQQYARDPELVQQASRWADTWASDYDWKVWEPIYRQMFHELAE